MQQIERRREVQALFRCERVPKALIAQLIREIRIAEKGNAPAMLQHRQRAKVNCHGHYSTPYEARQARKQAKGLKMQGIQIPILYEDEYTLVH